MELKWIAVLAGIPLFQAIKPIELERILRCLQLKTRDFAKHEYIIMVGDAVEGIGIMLAGSAVILKENAAGNRVIMAVLGPGDMFGEMAAFAGYNRWPATVYTQEPSTVTFLAPDKITGSCEQACCESAEDYFG